MNEKWRYWTSHLKWTIFYRPIRLHGRVLTEVSIHFRLRFLSIWALSSLRTADAFPVVACENIRFSKLFATQRQKFHTDDANQFLHNKSGSHVFPNINLSYFRCLLVYFDKVLSSSANDLQKNSNACSREDYIPQILTVLLGILRVYIWPLWPFVFCPSFVNSSYSVDQSALLTGFRTNFTSSVWNFCRWVADVPHETSPAMKSEEKRMFSQARSQSETTKILNE